MNWQGNVVLNIYRFIWSVEKSLLYTLVNVLFCVCLQQGDIRPPTPTPPPPTHQKKKKTIATTTKTKWCISKSYQFTHRTMNNQSNNRSLFPIIAPNVCKLRCCSHPKTVCSLYLCQDSRLLYYLIREIKTWLNINHITVHNNTYCIFSNSKNSYRKYKSHIINKLVIYVIYTHTYTHWSDIHTLVCSEMLLTVLDFGMWNCLPDGRSS